MIDGHFCVHDRLNGPSVLQRWWSEVKDETPFRYAHAEIRTRVVVICGRTRYQLEHLHYLGVYGLWKEKSINFSKHLKSNNIIRSRHCISEDRQLVVRFLTLMRHYFPWHVFSDESSKQGNRCLNLRHRLRLEKEKYQYLSKHLTNCLRFLWREVNILKLMNPNSTINIVYLKGLLETVSISIIYVSDKMISSGHYKSA